MKKWILIGGCGILVIIIVVLIVGISNLGPIIKAAVNIYGPKMTQTEVALGDVDVSLLSAEAKIKDFLLGNPKGFKSPHAMRVKSIAVDVDEKSLIEDTIVIDRIEVVGPDVTYERTGGTDNFKAILSNISAADSKASASSSEKSSGEEKGARKKIVIKDFIIKDGRVNLAMGMLEGKGISAPLPDIHLKNIGERSGGASPAEAFKQIFSALYSKIVSPAVTNILNNGLKEIGSSLLPLGDEVKKAGDNAVESVTKEVEKAADKLKGLFSR